jgi:hypothetical protein
VKADDLLKVGWGEAVAAAEHGEGDLPVGGLALKPALFHPQARGGFLGCVQPQGIRVVVVLSFHS